MEPTMPDEARAQNQTDLSNPSHGYAKWGNLKSARELFDMMPEKNSVSWTAFIAGCAQHGMGYEELELFTRMVLYREDRKVCHGILVTYSIDVVIRDVKKFLSETQSEIIILEIRTEFGHEDPPEFDKYLEEQLGEYLIHQDDHVFGKTIAELLPKRIICVWKPRKSPQPKAGGPLWSAGVENTVTPQADNPILCVRPVTGRIHGFARLFINQCVAKGCADKLQIFSTDFIGGDFVDACVGLTYARIEVTTVQMQIIYTA
ncbi:Pentatricopeptide repeat [Dillenia turbinata]|uniref:Pentatricopeptide repeat n=1 Tax=Dillenia turbinata TaxID=194707 RepID=A0AAN8W5E5_9MAGN